MHVLLRISLLISLLPVAFGLVGCGAGETPPVAAPTPVVIVQTVEVPVKVESTRIVEQQVIVTATPSPPTPCHARTLSETNEIVIGALAPLSGRSATGGLPMQAGITIAVDKLNSEGGIQGKPVRIVTYDTASNPEIGAQRASQLITQDCAVGVIGIYDSDVALTVKEVLHTQKIPGIFVDTYHDEITASLYPEVFRIAPGMTMFAEMAGKWLHAVGDYNGDGQISAVIVAEDSPYGIKQTEQTVQGLVDQGIQHRELLVDLPTNDFSSVIARIVDMDVIPDAILIRVSGESGLLLQQQLLQNGVGPKKETLIVASQSALDDKLFWQIMGEDGLSTVVLRVGPWSGTISEEGKRFVERYEQFNPQWPTNAAFGGYDAVRLLGDAIQRSTTLQGEDILIALENSEIMLASGRYNFPVRQSNPPEQNTPTYLWHQWQNVPLLYLQYTEINQPASAMAVIWPDEYRTSEGPIVIPTQ